MHHDSFSQFIVPRGEPEKTVRSVTATFGKWPDCVVHCSHCMLCGLFVVLKSTLIRVIVLLFVVTTSMFIALLALYFLVATSVLIDVSIWHFFCVLTRRKHVGFRA